MDEEAEMKETQIAEYEKARLICGNVEAIRDGVLECVELRYNLPADKAIHLMVNYD